MAIIKKFRIKSFKNVKSVIEFENISLSYGNRQILENINFKINEGQIFGMLGPNGVGKSTIFNLITGLISPLNGKINIADSYAIEKNGEIILINSHISSYKQASYSNHNPTDERKLLLNKREINKLIGKMQRDGFTIVPTKMYFKKGKAKVELAVAKGKKQYDKRAT